MGSERKIILTRHLATEYNKSGVLMGREVDLDIKRDDVTVKQFEDRIKGVAKTLEITPQNTMVCSSPLRRCIETSRLVTRTLGLPGNILVIQDLIETNMGDFSGKKASELRREYGVLVDQWMHNPEEFTFPGGESYMDVRNRVKLVMGKIKREVDLNHYKNIFVCTHVDLVKMFFSEILGFSFNERRNLVVPNGSISILGISDDGKLTVEGVNVFPS